MAVAKGSALLATLGFVEANYGAAMRERVFNTLPANQRSQLARLTATDEIPFRMLLDLWRIVDKVVSPQDAEWMEKAGAHSIESMGTQMYGGIVRKASPSEFLNQPIKLFRLYYHSGDMQIVEEAGGRAVIRLVDFDEPDVLFCRRQTGGLRRALEIAGGKGTRVRHVRCANEGDAFCEWEMVWGDA
jgi:hypothetical protein